MGKAAGIDAPVVGLNHDTPSVRDAVKRKAWPEKT
jgi:hypothetical protein